MVNAILYVLYYNDETKARAMAEYGMNPICKFLFVPTTIWQENTVIMELLIQRIDEWKSCDYVGMISHKAREKCVIPKEFSRLDRAKAEGYQIICFNFAPSVDFYFKDGYKQHKNLEAIVSILGELVPLNLESTVPIWANYWFMTPSVLYKYIVFLRHMKSILENNTELKRLLWEDAGFMKPTANFTEVTGLEYFPHHPFVMERITGFFAGDFKTTHYFAL